MRACGMLVVLLSLGFSAMGCNTAKDSCEGTLASYAGCINSQNPSCIVRLVHPSQRELFGDKVIEAWAKSNWDGVSDLTWEQLKMDKAWNICRAKTVAKFKQKGAKNNLSPYQSSPQVIEILPAKGGNWYLSLPGAAPK